jgi:nucleoid-associated protein YgaU
MEPSATGRRNGKPAYSPPSQRAQSTGFNVPQPAAPANDPQDEKLHVVQQGETYWSISRQQYGAGRYFQALAEYNKPRISDQQALKPGMKVLVPSVLTLETRYGKLMQASGHAKPPAKPQAGLRFNSQGQPLYIVGEGDTLGEIATRYLGKTLRSDEIYQMNKEQLPTANSLKPGMVLVMPNDAAETGPASSIPGRR